jgi:hypothetical protein
MSKTSHSSTWKSCATCEFYSGSREPDAFMKRVSFELDQKAKCLGKWKPNSYGPNHTCSGWVMWGVLKK